MNQHYSYLSIRELSKRIQAQSVSPVEVVRACLDRIDALNPTLNAFITVLAEQALEQAQAADADIKAGKWRGQLHGIPVGIKDFYDTAGIRTTAGFEYFKERVPANDASGVTRLKDAGAIIIGKMNMHQLGMGTTGLESAFGPAQNPWNADYIPGGSSSGSAAAVASGMCHATFDTDAIGSCRLPAACCGVVGFKGTFGLISGKGILEGTQEPDEMIKWFSHPAITARSADDIALVLDVLAEGNEQTPAAGFAGGVTQATALRIGVANNFRAEPEVADAFAKAIEVIGGLGYTMSEVAAPFGNPVGGLANIEADRKAIAGQAFSDVDVILLPTIPTTVPAVKDATGNPQALSPELTAFANYYGLPAISVPCGFDSNGLPLGLQMVSKPWNEAAVLRLAHQFEGVMGLGGRHPIED